ncbi:MAG TPA: DegT/DnrJ/EryC1/StrS family aminotransferase [Alphaproteobacteria bacterium]
MSSQPLPFVDLKAQYARLRPSIDARMRKVLEHGQYILGPEVAELETALASFSGARHAIAVASGTEALHMPLMAEGIGPGDAVFLPGFTFPATAEVVLAVGATPVFVDVAEDSYNIDPAALDSAVETVRRRGELRPRAVIPVDLFGLPADYAAIDSIVRRHGLFVLADAAQSYGAALGNRRVGTLAPMTAVSFFPAKPLGCYGDGGAILTDSADDAKILRSIRMHGEGDDRYDIVRLGTNGRLDTLQAAVLLAKLEVFQDELDARERWASEYDRRLKGRLVLPPRRKDATSAWAQYCVRVPRRDAVREKLTQQGIPTAVYYPKPLHVQPAFARFAHGLSLPVSEKICGQIMALPMHPYLDEATVECIAQALLQACG